MTKRSSLPDRRCRRDQASNARSMTTRAGGRQTSPTAVRASRRAGSNQLHRDIVQARIVSDDEKGVRAARLADQFHQPSPRGVVDAVLIDVPGRFCEGGGDELPGLLGAARRGYQRQVRNQPMVSHIGADDGGVGLGRAWSVCGRGRARPVRRVRSWHDAAASNGAWRQCRISGPETDSSAADLKFLPRCGNVGQENSSPPPQVRKTME